MYQMTFPRVSIILLLMTLAAGLLWFTGSSLASNDRAVTLRYFFVEPIADGRMQIEWATSQEDAVDFRIIRAEYPDTPIYPTDLISITYMGTPTNFVPALGNNSDYVAFDIGATNGVTYTYMLVEQDTNTGFSPVDSDIVQAGNVAFADIAVSPSTSERLGSSTMPAAHPFTVTNNGNRSTTLRARTVAGSHMWTPTFSEVFFRLNPGASTTLTATVTPDSNAVACSSDTVTVEIVTTDVFSDTDSQLVYPTTTLPCVYLPVVISAPVD